MREVVVKGVQEEESPSKEVEEKRVKKSLNQIFTINTLKTEEEEEVVEQEKVERGDSSTSTP
jgi:hypothetical protein